MNASYEASGWRRMANLVHHTVTRTKHSIGENDEREIIRMIRDGVTHRRIAALVGCSTSVVSRVRNGFVWKDEPSKWKRHPHPRGNGRFTADQVREMRKLYLLAPLWNTYNLADAFGCDQSTVQRIVSRRAWNNIL